MRDRLISAKHTTRYALKNGFHHEIAIKFHHEGAPTSFLPRVARRRAGENEGGGQIFASFVVEKFFSWQNLNHRWTS
jgi:hypothetical protein